MSLNCPFGRPCTVDLEVSKYTNTYCLFGQHLAVQVEVKQKASVKVSKITVQNCNLGDSSKLRSTVIFLDGLKLRSSTVILNSPKLQSTTVILEGPK